MILILEGPPGSGKDTQAEILRDQRGFVILSPGKVLRERAKSDSQLKSVLDSGELVNDNIVNQIIESFVIDHIHSSIIFDGAPRDVSQVHWLTKLFEKLELTETVRVIELTVSTTELAARIAQRGRHDDKPASFQHRLELFESTIRPAIRLLAEKYPSAVVDGGGTVEAIAARINLALEA